LPAIYANDSFARRLCQGLDEVLVPALVTLEGLPAYFDPATAPADMLEWLADWVGVTAAAELPITQRRELVAAAAQLHVWRRTLSAIRAAIELSAGQTAEIVESGNTAISASRASDSSVTSGKWACSSGDRRMGD
jgi:phage tail-like protein